MKNKAVELRGINKSFGAVLANENVSLSVERGSVHAIVGENGAGKSTAMKILYGQYQPDAGEIRIHDVAHSWDSPAAAIAEGLGMVHQHFLLARQHTALENILLASQRTAFSCLPFASARTKVERLMQEFAMEVDLDRPVEKLPLGMQQRIEILKLLYCDSQILIFDEPTAVLAPQEISALFQTLRGMAAQGKTILIITHKLKEVLDVADRVTIFRAGRVVAEREVSEMTFQELAALMVGREVADMGARKRPAPGNQVLLELQAAQPRAMGLEHISLRLRAGEILGIAGVEGNGQSELLRLLLHPRRELGSGKIFLCGQDVSAYSTAELRALGLGVFPEDRREEGLLLDSSLKENFLLGRQRAAGFRTACFLNRRKIRAATLQALRDFDVRPPNPEAMADSLSGGNQQKLLVARELAESPKVLLAAQPTRGVDIGAIEFIHERLLALRDSGAAVLLLSSELEEVLQLSDRVLVIFRGKIVGSFSREDLDENKIGLLMAGAEEHSA